MSKKLTLQELELLNTASAYNGEQNKAICGKAALELIEYKRIEQELGIDLITLLKALKNGVFYRDFRGDPIKHTNNLRLERFNGKKFCLSNKNHYFTKEDYGNGKYNAWALTREELE